jgi:hypothetical protein
LTVRTIIKCETCDQYIIPRVLLGHNEHPSYVFSCPNCEEKIELGMNLFPETASWEFLYEENCKPITKNELKTAEEEGVVINLTAEFPIHESLRNMDTSFIPQLLISQQRLFGRGKYKNRKERPDIHKNWKSLRRAINQSIKGKKTLAKRYLQNYIFFYDNAEEDYDIFSQIHDFITFFLSPEKNKYLVPVLETMRDDQGKSLNEYKRFLHYFIPNLFEMHFQKLINIISKYMDNFESLFPYLLFIRKEEKVPKDVGSSTFDFDELKYFYGELFELISSLFEFFVIINNIHQDRSYNELKTINLRKYKTIDKAKRYEPFKDVPMFLHFAEEFDSTIRNASHHNNFALKDSFTIVYSYGKPLKEKYISVDEYLVKCNMIFINVLSIFDLFLFTNEFSRQIINKWAYR